MSKNPPQVPLWRSRVGLAAIALGAIGLVSCKSSAPAQYTYTTSDGVRRCASGQSVVGETADQTDAGSVISLAAGVQRLRSDMNHTRPTTARLALILGVTAGLSLAGCGSTPDRRATQVQSVAHQSDGAASKSELPDGPTAIAGPDGKELPGATIDLGDRRKQLATLADRMIDLGREPSDDEARAFMIVYGASEVRNEHHELIGYSVGTYATPSEYEVLLDDALPVVTAAEAQR